jgi:hypothetical protein
MLKAMLAKPRRWLCVLSSVWLVALTATALASPVPPARGLSSSEREALSSGERVERPVRFVTRDGQYVGGIAYQVVRAPPQGVLSALADVERLPDLLPRTQSARRLPSRGDETRVLLTQGAGPFVASYGIQLVRVPGQNELRFWLDRAVPRDIEDVWGFFRAEPRPDGRTLVTVAVAVDLGSGLVRALFEERVQAIVLRSVSRIRDAVEPAQMAEARFR